MNHFWYEFAGTALLLLLGNGVVANVLLTRSKGYQSGWMVIALGWAMAVFMGVAVSSRGSAAHLNPAITLANACFSGNWQQVPLYLLAQFSGAATGALLIALTYWPHFKATTDPAAVEACFCTAPAIDHPIYNFFVEMMGTAVLVFGALLLSKGTVQLGAIDALPVALLVLAIGLSLGGPTGYAINPARDLAPRLVLALLPFAPKPRFNARYAWIPVAAPVSGAIAGQGLYRLLVAAV